MTEKLNHSQVQDLTDNFAIQTNGENQLCQKFVEESYTSCKIIGGDFQKLQLLVELPPTSTIDPFKPNIDKDYLAATRMELAGRLSTAVARQATNEVAGVGKTIFEKPEEGNNELFDTIDGKDDEGIFSSAKDGAITRNGLFQYLNYSMRIERVDRERHRFPIPLDTLEGVREIYLRWDNQEMSAYKNDDGVITRKSFEHGMQTLPEREKNFERDIEYYFSPEALRDLYIKKDDKVLYP